MDEWAQQGSNLLRLSDIPPRKAALLNRMMDLIEQAVQSGGSELGDSDARQTQ